MLTFVAYLLTLCWYGALAYPTSDCTNKPADVVFILDSSNSIWPGDFTKQTAFVRDVVKQFDIGPGPTQTRVGVLTFGHEVWKQFDLKDKMDVESLVKSLDAIGHGRGRRTNTGDAIKFAVEDMFSEKAGHRLGVSRVAVVITDGRSQNTRSTKDAAKLAHDSGIKTFAVGVGRYIDLNELQVIASDPDEDYLYMVDDFNALSSIRVRLAKKACDVTEAPQPIVSTTPMPVEPQDESEKVCGGKPADVFFIVDSSGSIESKDFNKEVQFIQNVAKLFDVSRDKTRVGIINFSHEAQMVLPLDNGLDKSKLLTKIRNIEHLGGGTYTSDAIRMVRQDGFTSALYRREAAKVAIVLTDGLSMNEDLTRREALLTQNAGVKIFAIGIGPWVDLVELKNIASNPDDTYVYQVNDFNSLESIKDALAINTCKVKPEKPDDDQKKQPVCLMKKNTDMMFVYDTAALGPWKSQAISDFVATIIQGLDVSSGYLNIGRITDNCPTGGNFQLSNKLTAEDFKSIGVSNYYTLLKKVRRAGFTPEYGGRDGASNVSVLFIDSDTVDRDGSALDEAKLLKGSSEVFVVSIGDSPVVRNFAGSFRGNNYFHVNSYDDLQTTARNLIDQFCYYFFIDFADYNVDYVLPV